MVKVYQYDLNNKFDIISSDLINVKKAPFTVELVEESEASISFTINYRYNRIYGMGERFNQVNQNGKEVEVEITEKFCNQGEISYCPIPFFFTDTNFGVFLNTFTVSNFDFSPENEIRIAIKRDSKGLLPDIYFFLGAPKEIIESYARITGMPQLSPKWAFGPWMSANRWNTEAEVDHQLALLEEHQIPHTVMVLEAWSDEATFYRFNDHGEWKNPKKMVERLKEKEIHLILWQIPVLKKMDHNESHPILDQDKEFAVAHDYVIKNLDGTPYCIPENHWFAGSYLLDFTNPDAVKWWFDQRQYLLDMGIDGFKTDGGEFVLTDDVIATNGATGLEMRNQYTHSYVKAYSNFVGKDRVLFSRAGYKGQQNFPMQWAGDQMSTWEEFRHVMTAGISIGLSGVPYWGFDIAGFAGNMPAKELYERATQVAVFTPIMQWHSEPVGGQFALQYPSADGINDRSPWNISLLYNDASLINRLRFHYNLRMNLLPYIYNEAILSSQTGLPMMKHLILEYPEDERVYNIEDIFMLGDLLVAPLLYEGENSRIVYLPEGEWTPMWDLSMSCVDDGDSNKIEDEAKLVKNNEFISGGQYYRVFCDEDRIPVFIRQGACIVLNLDHDLALGSYIGNKLKYQNLCLYLTGENGAYHFRDDFGNDIKITWNEHQHSILQNSKKINFVMLDKL